VLGVLDDLILEIQKEQKKPYPYAEWERKRKKVKEKLKKLPEYVEKAASMVETQKRTGRPKVGTLVQRTMLFLFARMMSKSNRDVEDLLELFGPLFEISVSYKSVERLYSDEEVKVTIHNLFILLLNDEELNGDVAGDGTGYSLLITKHYASNPDKRSKDYKYAFRIIDLDTGMYVGVGYSAKSEMGAFRQAMEMIKNLGIKIKSGRFDKYFSSRKVLEIFDRKTIIYVIPKKNISKIGLRWSRIIRRIIEGPYKFLKDYFGRNLSEAGYSSDKRRFGWMIRQKREDRQESAMFAIALLHNIFFVRIKPS